MFYLQFTLGIILCDRCDRKTPTIFFIKVKPPFSVVEFSNTATFRRNTRFDVISTSVTINKQDLFSLQIVLF